MKSSEIQVGMKSFLLKCNKNVLVSQGSWNRPICTPHGFTAENYLYLYVYCGFSHIRIWRIRINCIGQIYWNIINFTPFLSSFKYISTQCHGYMWRNIHININKDNKDKKTSQYKHKGITTSGQTQYRGQIVTVYTRPWSSDVLMY